MSFDSSSRVRENSSHRVSQIFDSYMSQIAPRVNAAPLTASKPPSNNTASLPSLKENSFARSNYHKQSFCQEQSSNSKLPPQKFNQSFVSSSSPGEQPRTLNRCDSASVLAIKALQTKLTDQEQAQSTLVCKLQESQASLESMRALYSQLQLSYSKLEGEHRELIPVLAKYQQDILAMKAQKEKQIKDLSVRFEEQLQVLKRESERSRVIEMELAETKNILLESQGELKKERSSTQRLKHDFRQQMDKNDKQFEEQIEYYHKTNSQLQEQVQKMIAAEAKFQKEKQGLEKELATVITQNEQLSRENKELKTLYEEQMKYLENDVKKVFEEQKSQIAQLTTQKEYDLPLKKEIEKLLLQVATLTDSNNSSLQKLEKEQIKNSQLELQLAQIVNQIKGTQSSNKKNKTEEPFILPKQDSDSKAIKLAARIDEESVFSYEEKSSIRDQEYNHLLQEIISVESKACELNQQYQHCFQAYSQVSNSDKNDLKQQMNDIMNKIKLNNSKLYDLKSKEFFLLSQSVS